MIQPPGKRPARLSVATGNCEASIQTVILCCVIPDEKAVFLARSSLALLQPGQSRPPCRGLGATDSQSHAGARAPITSSRFTYAHRNSFDSLCLFAQLLLAAIDCNAMSN